MFLLFAFIMGPGRSSSLRIGGDPSVAASSARTRGASDRSATDERQNSPEAPPLPLDKGKGRVNLIKYPGDQNTSNQPSSML